MYYTIYKSLLMLIKIQLFMLIHSALTNVNKQLVILIMH